MSIFLCCCLLSCHIDMASCWLIKNPTTKGYLEIKMRVWLGECFCAKYDDQKSIFAISSEIPS